MGLFDGLDLASAEDVVSGIPAGPHPAVVENCELQNGSTNNPDGKFLVWTYNSPSWPFPLKEFKEIPQGAPATWDRTIQDAKGKTEFTRKDEQRRYLKARLISLGLPVSRIDSFDNPAEFVGLKVIVTVRKRNGYTNVGDVELPKSSGVTLPGSVSTVKSDPITAGATQAGMANPFAAGL